MATSTDERPEAAVATLNDLIALVGRHGMHETGQFLAMAKLHLLMELNNVSDRDLRAFCAFLESETKKGPPAKRMKPARARDRREADMRGMRRAWLCAPDTGSPRGGRSRAKQ